MGADERCLGTEASHPSHYCSATRVVCLLLHVCSVQRQDTADCLNEISGQTMTFLSVSISILFAVLPVLILLLARLPRSDNLRLQGFPSPPWLAFQAVISLLSNRKQQRSKASTTEGPPCLNKMEVSSSGTGTGT